MLPGNIAAKRSPTTTTDAQSTNRAKLKRKGLPSCTLWKVPAMSTQTLLPIMHYLSHRHSSSFVPPLARDTGTCNSSICCLKVGFTSFAHSIADVWSLANAISSTYTCGRRKLHHQPATDHTLSRVHHKPRSRTLQAVNAAPLACAHARSLSSLIDFLLSCTVVALKCNLLTNVISISEQVNCPWLSRIKRRREQLSMYRPTILF